MHPLHRDPSHFSLSDERPSFTPSFVTIGGFEYVEVSPTKYILAQEFEELQEREGVSRISTNPSLGVVSLVLSNHPPSQFPIEPYCDPRAKIKELYDHTDRVCVNSGSFGRRFSYVQNPYEHSDFGDLAFFVFLTNS